MLLHELGHVQDAAGLREHSRIDIDRQCREIFAPEAERQAEAYANTFLGRQAIQTLRLDRPCTVNTIR